MPRRRASAADRGYGWDHRKVKDTYRPAVEAGNAYCTEPICKMGSRWIQPGTTWDLAHNRASGGYRGPAHSKCNRAEGAAYGNRTRGRTFTPRTPRTTRTPSTWHSRDWTVAPDLPPTKTCDHCGINYKPYEMQQKYCTVTCYNTARRPQPKPQATPPLHTRRCGWCGDTYTTTHTNSRYCTFTCSDERNRVQARTRYRARVGIPVTAPLIKPGR